MIEIVQGNIFNSGADVICHQVNCRAAMRSGVAKQVRELFPEVFEAYRRHCNTTPNSELLGSVQFCVIDERGNGRFIANIFAQEDFGYDGKQYSDYEALREALDVVNTRFAGKSIAIPYLMSCHRGGGEWDCVNQIIVDALKDCKVTYYQYDGS